MTRPASLLLVIPLLVLAPAVARADMVGFSYSWSIASGDLYVSGPGPITLSQSAAPDGSSVTVNYGSGSGTLTVAPAGSASATAGGADFLSAIPASIPLGTLTSSALTGPTGNFSFSANNNITLNLTDTLSGQSGTLSLSGSIGGTVAPDGSASLGTSAYGNSFQSVVLGGHTYSVEAGNGLDPADLVAQVFIDRPAPDGVTLASGGVSPQPFVPEPSSLLLAGCALSLVVIRLWKRRFYEPPLNVGNVGPIPG